VIDVHGHIMPDGLARIRRVIEENGIDRMVNLSGGSFGDGVKEAVALAQASEKLLNFYIPDWRLRAHPEFGELVAQRLELAVNQFNYRGLKISKALGLYLTLPDGSRMPVDWKGLDPLWAMAGALKVPVAIHTGDPRAFWDPVDAANERYEELALHPSWSFHGPRWPSREALLAERDRVIARHPETTFICVHFGNNPEDLDAVDRLLDTYANVMLDTSARLPEIGRHPAPQVRAFFIKHKERIMFGTDLGLGSRGIMLGSSGADEPGVEDIKPFYDAHWRFFEGREVGIAHPTPIQGDWKIDAIDLPEDVLDHLYHLNARRVLGLDLEPVAKEP